MNSTPSNVAAEISQYIDDLVNKSSQKEVQREVVDELPVSATSCAEHPQEDAPDVQSPATATSCAGHLRRFTCCSAPSHSTVLCATPSRRFTSAPSHSNLLC